MDNNNNNNYVNESFTEDDLSSSSFSTSSLNYVNEQLRSVEQTRRSDDFIRETYSNSTNSTFLTQSNDENIYRF